MVDGSRVTFRFFEDRVTHDVLTDKHSVRDRGVVKEVVIVGFCSNVEFGDVSGKETAGHDFRDQGRKHGGRGHERRLHFEDCTRKY